MQHGGLTIVRELIVKLRNTYSCRFESASLVDADDLEPNTTDGVDIAISSGELKLESGTTLAAINCGKAGVVVGGESRATLRDKNGKASIASDSFRKVFQIDDSTILAFAGEIGAGIEIRQELKRFLGVWRDIKREVSVKGRVRTLARALRRAGAMVIPILAMWGKRRVRDRKTRTFRPRGGRLYMMCPDGSYLKLDYVTAGSGGDTIRRTIREYCEMTPTDERDPADAALLVYHMLAGVVRDDPYSGGMPNVMIVDENGVRDVRFFHIAPRVSDKEDDETSQSHDGPGEEGS